MPDLAGLVLMLLVAVAVLIVAARNGALGSVQLIGRFDTATGQYAGDVELGMLTTAQQTDAANLNDALRISREKIDRMRTNGARNTSIDAAIERHDRAAELARTGVASWPASTMGTARSRRQLNARVRQMLGKNLRVDAAPTNDPTAPAG